MRIEQRILIFVVLAVVDYRVCRNVCSPLSKSDGDSLICATFLANVVTNSYVLISIPAAVKIKTAFLL